MVEFGFDLKEYDAVAIAERRRALVANGYRLVEVRGKKPFKDQWQHATPSASEVAGWGPYTGTGLICGRQPGGEYLIGVDIDILNPVLALEVENKAIEMLGANPLRRVGRAPKLLIPYLCDHPYSKIPLSGVGQVEILSTGQQFVAYSIHPDTREPYRWDGPAPEDVALAVIPATTPAQMDQFMMWLRERFPPVASNGSIPLSAPPDTRTDEELIAEAHQPNSWHIAVRTLTARWVRLGWDDGTIYEQAEALTCLPFSVEKTKREMEVMVEGARARGFGPISAAADKALGMEYIRQNTVSLTDEEPVPEFLLQDMIRTGINTISGYLNTGKTVAVLVMALNIARLMHTPKLPPSIRRKVYYLSEDTAQVSLLVRHRHKNGLIPHTLEEVNQWFVVVRIKRRDTAAWQQTLREMVKDASEQRAGEAWWEVPVVFFDTGAASFTIKNNDDNAEVSAHIAALKEVCPVPGWPALTLSVVLILHVAKSQRGSEAEEINSLGAQAWGADVNGSLVFWKAGNDERFLYLVKKRGFNPKTIQWRVDSEDMDPIVTPTPWRDRYPELATYTQRPLAINAFEPVTKDEVKEDRKQAAYNEKFNKAKGKFDRLMGETEKGLAFYAPGESGGQRPEGFRFCSWPEVLPKSKSDDDVEKIREDLIRVFHGNLWGEKGRFMVFKKEDQYGAGTPTSSPPL